MSVKSLLYLGRDIDVDGNQRKICDFKKKGIIKRTTCGIKTGFTLSKLVKKRRAKKNIFLEKTKMNKGKKQGSILKTKA